MKIQNLNVRFKDNVVYDDFSIEFDNSKITCILGPSGCGKTTLLNVLTNNVQYIGNVLEKEKFSYVFQNPRLIDSITVEENLKFVLNKEDYSNSEGPNYTSHAYISIVSTTAISKISDTVNTDHFSELTETLKSLGYKAVDIKKVLSGIDPNKTLENQVKDALKLLLK